MVVLIIGGFLFYTVLEGLFYKQIDQGLLTEKDIIETELQHDAGVPDYSSRFGHEIAVDLYNKPAKKFFLLKDTAITDSASDEAYYRYLTVVDNKNKHGYSIRILQPLSSTELLFRSVVNVMLVMLVVLILISLIINYLVSRRLWLPFYSTVRRISRYDIKEKALIEFPETNVTEFRKLNEVLNTMSKKIRRDFYNLKEFTENASHEIQTPLAIVKSKIEILVQSDNLTPAQVDAIQNIDKAVTRLSKLNSGLILITKIENNQYGNLEDVSLTQLIERTIENFDEFIHHKNLTVSLQDIEHPVLSMNPILAEILLNNLINNAIKYNTVNGYIQIDITSDRLSVSNSGDPLDESIKPSDLFHRFKKNNKESDSLGLGLAIVKKICDFHRMRVSFASHNGHHTITLDFRK
jgi:signal transduction histidine kinase